MQRSVWWAVALMKSLIIYKAWQARTNTRTEEGNRSCTYRTNATVRRKRIDPPADQHQQPCASYRTFPKSHTAIVHIKIPNPYNHHTQLHTFVCTYLCACVCFEFQLHWCIVKISKHVHVVIMFTMDATNNGRKVQKTIWSKALMGNLLWP